MSGRRLLRWLRRACLAGIIVPGMTPPSAADPQPQPQIVERIDDWLVGCLPAEAGRTRCELFQQMTLRDTGQRLFRLSFRLQDSGAVESLAIAPFGLQLRAGITFTVDEGMSFAGDFVTCFADGCLSRFVVPADILAALEHGKTLTAAMAVYEGETFRVPFALAGLSDGLARLKDLAQP